MKLLLTDTRCVRSIRLERQNKCFLVWASRSVNKSIIVFSEYVLGICIDLQTGQCTPHRPVYTAILNQASVLKIFSVYSDIRICID